MDKDSGIVDIIVDKHSINDETFNRENIIANFEEYLFLNSIGLGNFVNFEDKNNTGREFYITASIFSVKLDELLKAFDEKIINNPDFIKIKEKDKDFIEKIRRDKAFKKFKKAKKNRHVKPNFKSMINQMEIFKAMSENDMENLGEYDILLSKLIPNLEATVRNLEVIEESIKTIENG